MADILPRFPLMYTREEVIDIILARFAEVAKTQQRLESVEQELSEAKKMAARAVTALSDGHDSHVRDLLRDIQSGARR